jgi:hypothetical protein
MAGKNSGKSGAAIGESASIGLSYAGPDNSEFKISNLSKPVDMWIKRSESLAFPEYNLIDINKMKNRTTLITYKFFLTGLPVSTHIQLKKFKI